MPEGHMNQETMQQIRNGEMQSFRQFLKPSKQQIIRIGLANAKR